MPGVILGIVFYWTFGVSILVGPDAPDYDWEMCRRNNRFPCTRGGWRETGVFQTREACEREAALWTPPRFLAGKCVKVIAGYTD